MPLSISLSWLISGLFYCVFSASSLAIMAAWDAVVPLTVPIERVSNSTVPLPRQVLSCRAGRSR